MVSRRSFQTSRSHGNVGRSRSCLGLKIKCLSLVPSDLIYKPICTAFCFIAELHVHHFECKASILLTDSQFTYLLECKCMKLGRLKVSKIITVSALQDLSWALGLVSWQKSDVSVSSRSRGIALEGLGLSLASVSSWSRKLRSRLHPAPN